MCRDFLAGLKRRESKLTDQLLLRPAEVAKLLAIGRTRAYELIARGTLPSIRLGSSVRVPADALTDWIARQLAEHAGDGQ